MTFKRYMARRRYWEAGLWLLAITVSFVANLALVFYDMQRLGFSMETWKPVVWEGSGHLAMGLLIPLVLLFDRIAPVRARNWHLALLAHAALSVVYALAHVALMYWIRIGLYQVLADGARYYWSDWWGEFGYEYAKELRSYVALLMVIYLYRFVLRRLRGEAVSVVEGKEESAAVPVPDRFLVKRLGGEFLLPAGDIDRVEANGDRVNLYVGERCYPLSETMSAVTERLIPQGFGFVGEAALVNPRHAPEIVAIPRGDGEADDENDGAG